MGKTIKHSKSWYFNSKLIAHWLGMAVCVLFPLISALFNLPSIVVYKEETSTINGVFVAACICASGVIFRELIKNIKAPSIVIIFWIFYGIMYLINSTPPETINALTEVFKFAAIGNSIGAVLFKAESIFDELWKHCGQVEIVSGEVNNNA